MRLFFNNIIPIKGFVAINLFGSIFIRKAEWTKLSKSQKNIILQHEAIHTAQMKELCFVFFYIFYFIEWIIRLIFKTKTAYSGLSFEKEAYTYMYDSNYLKNRKHYAQWLK